MKNSPAYNVAFGAAYLSARKYGLSREQAAPYARACALRAVSLSLLSR